MFLVYLHSHYMFPQLVVGGFFLDIIVALIEELNENLITSVEVGTLQPYYYYSLNFWSVLINTSL